MFFCHTIECFFLFTSPTGSDGRGYLARTYYAEVEYVLPGAVMQPVWNSVHKPDGTVNYGLSYHRAFYSEDYDDYHDIYLQRQASYDKKKWCVLHCRHIYQSYTVVEVGWTLDEFVLAARLLYSMCHFCRSIF